MPADPDAKIPCPTQQHLQAELDALADVMALGEREETWEKMEKALIRFAGVTRGGGYKHLPLYTDGVGRKGVGPQIAATMISDRGRFSAAAIDLLQTLAPRLGLSFQSIVQVYLEPLIKLLARPNKVFFKRAEKCLHTIISHCHLPTIVIELKRGLTDDAVGCRRGCAVGMERAMREWDRGIWGEKGLLVLEEGLRRIAVDKDQEVRSTGKRVWKLFGELWPERVEEFCAPLTPTTRRYLEIAGTNAPNKGKGKAPAKPMAPPLRPIPNATLASSFSSAAPKPALPRVQSQATHIPVSEHAIPHTSPIKTHRISPLKTQRISPIKPQRTSPTKTKHTVSRPASPTKDDPPRPTLHKSRSISGAAMRALDPSRHGRSVSHAILPTSTTHFSSPSTDPFQLSKPTRPALPSSFSSVSLPGDPFDLYPFHPTQTHPRRLPPAVRVASTSSLPQHTLHHTEEIVPALLRGAQRAAPEEWFGVASQALPKKMGQAQRRIVTAPTEYGGGVSHTPGPAQGWGPKTGNRSVRARVEQLEAARGEEGECPVSPTALMGVKDKGKVQVDSPLMPVLRKGKGKGRGKGKDGEMSRGELEGELGMELEDLRLVQQMEGGDDSLIEAGVGEGGKKMGVISQAEEGQVNAIMCGMASAPVLEEEGRLDDGDLVAIPNGQVDDRSHTPTLTPAPLLVEALVIGSSQALETKSNKDDALDQAVEFSTAAVPVGTPLPDTPVQSPHHAQSSATFSVVKKNDEVTPEASDTLAESQSAVQLDSPAELSGKTESSDASKSANSSDSTAKVELPPPRKPITTSRVVSGGSTVERRPFKPTSQVAKPSTAPSQVKSAVAPKPAVPTAREALAASKAAVTKAALATTAAKPPNTTAPKVITIAKPLSTSTSNRPVDPAPPRKPEVPKASAITKPRVPSNPKPPVTFPKAAVTLPPVASIKIKRKPPIPQFVPVTSAKRALSSSNSAKRPPPLSTVIRAKVRPESIALPASPEKPNLPPTDIPLPPTPTSASKISQEIPSTKSPGPGPSPLRQSMVAPPTRRLTVSPSLANAMCIPLPSSPSPATSPLARFAYTNSPKLVEAPSPSSYSSPRPSLSSRFISQPSTRVSGTERESSDEDDQMQGVSFGQGEGKYRVGRPRVKVGVEVEGERDRDRDLIEFSEGSRRVRGVVLGELLDVNGTPGKGEDGSKAFVGTPRERRRVLSMRDVNEGL